MIPLNKMCLGCEKSLLLINFSQNKGGKYGVRARCDRCEQSRKKTYYSNNVERILEEKKIYFQLNKDHIRKNAVRWATLKVQTDTLYKLKINVSRLIRSSLTKLNNHKKSRTVEILGCPVSDLKGYIESQFTNVMNWDNYGTVWQIDHICPCSQAQNEEELLALHHYSNMRPLNKYGKGGNLDKSDKITPEGEIMCQTLLKRNWLYE